MCTPTPLPLHSQWTPCSLCIVYIDLWGSVKPSGQDNNEDRTTMRGGVEGGQDNDERRGRGQ